MYTKPKETEKQKNTATDKPIKWGFGHFANFKPKTFLVGHLSVCLFFGLIMALACRDPQSFSPYRIRPIQPEGVLSIEKLCGSLLYLLHIVYLSNQASENISRDPKS